MKWQVYLVVLCGLLFLASCISAQRQRGNRRNRQNRPNRPNRQNRPNRPNRQNRPNRRGNAGRRGRRPSTNQGRGPLVTLPTNSTECELIQVPMCRGMIGYSHTRLPNQFGHTTQLQVYRALEYMWPFMDIGCSVDFRTTACGYHLPKCTPGESELQLPCKETCNRARRCNVRMRQLQSQWPSEFKCRTLTSHRQGRCVPPKQRGESCHQRHLTCERNPIPLCQNLTFSQGSLPNMFLQCKVEEIEAEMQQFQDLLRTNCSPHLRFFMCGIYMPYCVRAETPFALPCREICEDVRQSCERVYRRLTGGLPWPSKFQCHRYPQSTNVHQVCASPSDVVLRTPEPEPESSTRRPRRPRTRSRTNN
ncbi:uncharacterized protein [Haliotis asinina]|uniref:uncharacterized protein n=1 Tax=Haliotis asinina TaxID=109174 RepID=UPI003532590A